MQSDPAGTAEAITEFTGRYRVFDPAEPHVIDEDGIIVYPTLLHAYYGMQARHAVDRMWIAAAPTPQVARRRGDLVRLKPPAYDWAKYRSWLMWQLYRRKFDEVGYDVLLGTGEATLVYRNLLHEQLWGDCRCGKLPDCAEPGGNLLGEMLARMRAKTRRQHLDAPDLQRKAA